MNIRMLINLINSVGGKAVKVFVVVDKGDERGKASVANISSEKGNNNPIDTFITHILPQFHSVAENINVYSSIHFGS